MPANINRVKEKVIIIALVAQTLVKVYAPVDAIQHVMDAAMNAQVLVPIPINLLAIKEP